MNLEQLVERIREAGLGEHEALVRQLAKSGVRLVSHASGSEPALGSSYLGGHPDLAGQPWPTYQEVPMEFVAQISLEELARVDSRQQLPSSGHLCFFRCTQWEWSDFVEGEEVYQLASVIHVDAPREKLVRVQPPLQPYSDEYVEDTTAPRIFEAVGVKLVETVTLPARVSAFVPNDLSDAAGKLAEFSAVVDDSESHHQLLTHMYENDFVEAMEREDVLLLQLSSDDGFSWGDMGLLYFVSSYDAVNGGDWSRVRIYQGVQ